MFCKNFKIRQRNYKRFYYCFLKRKVITLDYCKKCLKINPRVNKGISKKSDKMIKMEKDRKSILTDNFNKCYYCGKEATTIHEIFKGSNRIASMKNGFCIPLCMDCHIRTENDRDFYRQFQMLCKKKYLESHTIEEFRQILGKNYI